MRPVQSILFLVLAHHLAAQTNYTGRVLDSSGAAIANATLRLRCGGNEQTTKSTPTGEYRLTIPAAAVCLLEVSSTGFKTTTLNIESLQGATSQSKTLDITLTVGAVTESVQVGFGSGFGSGRGGGTGGGISAATAIQAPNVAYPVGGAHSFNTESYRTINENTFLDVRKNPLSTFSADADTASFTNTRRHLREGTLPPRDAVRVEEFLNYFRYQLPAPQGPDPIRIHTELAACPWQPKHKLLLVGLKTRELPPASIPPANFVFLIDVSGSMMTPQKLPLLKQSFRLLVEQLRPQDQVSIVVYAGASGVVLPTTKATNKEAILDAIQRLVPGGSTNGAAGIHLAYEVAKQSFIEGGNNRVILATDGDFNVGVSGDSELVRLIEEKRKSGVFLTILVYGMGNYKDGKLEQIASAGNGNFAYIDNILEARKFLVRELGQNLVTVAKDVKLQVEFNPSQVSEYRLIGYENRLLKAEDFRNDSKDAGELGSGHTMLALYELIPPGTPGEAEPVDPLRYQSQPKPKAKRSPEALYVKVRYKAPEASESKELSIPVLAATNPKPSPDFLFAASIAELAMILHESKHKGESTLESALALARQSLAAYQDDLRTPIPALIERVMELHRR